MEEGTIISKMQKLAKLIDYDVVDIRFLQEAMHCQKIERKKEDGKKRKNYTNDNYATLGDAILKFILSEYFFDKKYDKAEITRKREKLENNKTLVDLRNEANILDYAYNDQYFSCKAPKENKVPHSKHDVYIEAIIAAIYKDRGMDYCRNWVISFFKKHDKWFD